MSEKNFKVGPWKLSPRAVLKGAAVLILTWMAITCAELKFAETEEESDSSPGTAEVTEGPGQPVQATVSEAPSSIDCTSPENAGSPFCDGSLREGKPASSAQSPRDESSLLKSSLKSSLKRSLKRSLKTSPPDSMLKVEGTSPQLKVSPPDRPQ